MMVCDADADVGLWMPWLEILRIWLRVWPSGGRRRSRGEKGLKVSGMISKESYT